MTTCLSTSPISRRSDPASSKLAESHVTATSRAAQQRACLNQARARPGSTSAEIAKALGIDRHIPARRLPELLRIANGVRRGPLAKCTVSGRMAVTWFPHWGPAPDEAATPFDARKLAWVHASADKSRYRDKLEDFCPSDWVINAINAAYRLGADRRAA